MNSNNLTIIDNFFDDPDSIRNYALSLREYHPCDLYDRSAVYSGYRCAVSQSIQEIIKSKLELVLGKTFAKLNSSFHLNTISSIFGAPHKDDGVNRLDIAGVIYLNKNAPKGTGTVLYEEPLCEIDDKIKDYLSKVQVVYDVYLPHQNNVKLQIAKEIDDVKKSLNVMARSENIFNRLVVYSAQTLHSPEYYFGETLEDGRLTIAFHGKFNAE